MLKTSRSFVIAAFRSAPAKPICPSAGPNWPQPKQLSIASPAELEWSGDIDQVDRADSRQGQGCDPSGLLNRRGEQSGAVENAKGAVAEAEEKLGEIACRYRSARPANGCLQARDGDQGRRANLATSPAKSRNSKRDEQEARTAIDRALKTLRPAVANAGVLESMLGSAAGFG